MKTHQCLILFHQPDFDLARANALLTERGLSVTSNGDSLFVRWSDGPTLGVALRRGPKVQAEATKIGRGTSHAVALAACDAQLEISVADLEEVLDEMNTLIETQATLQSATGGWMFNTWNEQLSAPDEGAG